MTTNKAQRENLLGFIEPFLEEWQDRVGDHASAFRNWAVEQLLWDYNLSHEEIETTITDGSGDMGIDSWHLAEDRDSKTLFLIQSKDTAPERADLTKLRDGLVGLFDEKRLGEGNQEVRARAAALKETLGPVPKDDESNFTIEFHLVTSDIAPRPLQKENAALFTENITILGRVLPGSFFVHDIKSLTENLRVIHSEPIQAKFSIGQSECFFYETENGFKTVTAAVKANELARLFAQNRINLFRQNPRYFLQTRTSINKKILATLMGKDPHNFYLFNNGITAICDSMTPDPSEPSLTVENIQIVNGCQTTASIHEAWRNTSAAPFLDTIRVPIRIIATSGHASAKDLSGLIARATNDQNPVKAEDFRSGDRIQERLHAGFNLLEPKWFYENKRGVWATEYQGISKRRDYEEGKERYGVRKLLMKDLGQACLASLGRPADAADKASSIFDDDDLYAKVFPTHATALQLLLPYLLYLEANKLCIANAPKYEWSSGLRYLRYPMVFCVTNLIRFLMGKSDSEITYLDVTETRSLIESFDIRNSNGESWLDRLFKTSFEELAREIEDKSGPGIGARGIVRRPNWLDTPVQKAKEKIIELISTYDETAATLGQDSTKVGLRLLFPYPINTGSKV